MATCLLGFAAASPALSLPCTRQAHWSVLLGSAPTFACCRQCGTITATPILFSAWDPLVGRHKVAWADLILSWLQGILGPLGLPGGFVCCPPPGSLWKHGASRRVLGAHGPPVILSVGGWAEEATGGGIQILKCSDSYVLAGGLMKAGTGAPAGPATVRSPWTWRGAQSLGAGWLGSHLFVGAHGISRRHGCSDSPSFACRAPTARRSGTPRLPSRLCWRYVAASPSFQPAVGFLYGHPEPSTDTHLLTLLCSLAPEASGDV